MYQYIRKVPSADKAHQLIIGNVVVLIRKDNTTHIYRKWL